MQELISKEIKVMKHCIGLDYKKPYKRHGKEFYKPYRNYYATYVHDEVWKGLVGKDFSDYGIVDEKQRTVFYLTRKGLDALGESMGIFIYDEEV